jgi:hypothetical protein
MKFEWEEKNGRAPLHLIRASVLVVCDGKSFLAVWYRWPLGWGSYSSRLRAPLSRLHQYRWLPNGLKSISAALFKEFCIPAVAVPPRIHRQPLLPYNREFAPTINYYSFFLSNKNRVPWALITLYLKIGLLVCTLSTVNPDYDCLSKTLGYWPLLDAAPAFQVQGKNNVQLVLTKMPFHEGPVGSARDEWEPPLRQ